MTALQRLAHDVDVADALEAIVGAAVSQVGEICDQLPFHLFRIDEVGHAELARERFPLRIDIHADDLVRARHARALNDVEPDAAEAEDDDV